MLHFRLSMMLLALASSLQAAEPWPRYGGPTGDFRLPTPTAGPNEAEWKRPFGRGTSGIAACGNRYYSMSVVPKDGGKAGDEFVIALDPATGKTIWEESVPVALLAKQESFGGASMQPQATPAVHDGIVYTVGFTGLLQACSAADGKRLWSTDLVVDQGATPVQYGFAASPVAFNGKLVVAVGGKHATIAFDLKTGMVVWASEAAAPAYATPVPMSWKGRPMIMQLTRDTLFGFDAADGKTRWSFPLPKTNLTNVPTPIVFDDGRIVVSGQGIDGTRLLQLTEDGDSIAVKERWHQRKTQFFYTNWTTDGETAFGFPGNGGKRFTAVRLKDGAILSQDVGQTDANVVLLGKQLLLCRGDGLLSLGTPTVDGFTADVRGQATKGRCWAAPTIVGGSVIVRSETELAVIKLSSLTTDFKPPADSGVSALDAAFGNFKK